MAQEYRGGVLNGEHHGFGAMRFSNGDIYCGDWWKSRRHGLGKFVSHNSKLLLLRIHASSTCNMCFLFAV